MPQAKTESSPLPSLRKTSIAPPLRPTRVVFGMKTRSPALMLSSTEMDNSKLVTDADFRAKGFDVYRVRNKEDVPRVHAAIIARNPERAAWHTLHRRDDDQTFTDLLDMDQVFDVDDSEGTDIEDFDDGFTPPATSPNASRSLARSDGEGPERAWASHGSRSLASTESSASLSSTISSTPTLTRNSSSPPPLIEDEDDEHWTKLIPLRHPRTDGEGTERAWARQTHNNGFGVWIPSEEFAAAFPFASTNTTPSSAHRTHTNRFGTWVPPADEFPTPSSFGITNNTPSSSPSRTERDGALRAALVARSPGSDATAVNDGSPGVRVSGRLQDGEWDIDVTPVFD